ncbi:MAG: hypothetical protein K0S39_5795 [Paenibacillus sp.]|nr:hypothetical protein [Paenibacillus sp.]
MYTSERNRRHWVVLVWFIVAFFVFPLTPPISQSLPYEEHLSGQSNHAQVYMHLEPVPSKPSAYKPVKSGVETYYKESFYYYLSLLVLFLLHIHCKVPEVMKQYLLAPLKFTSDYVIRTHSTTNRL